MTDQEKTRAQLSNELTSLSRHMTVLKAKEESQDHNFPEADDESAIPDFLSGGGEMRALIRSIDWSKTPIGPLSEWSQALRTTVGMMLRARFPFILWWGPELIQIYNDPYRPIPGDKHPDSMGQPASRSGCAIALPDIPFYSHLTSLIHDGSSVAPQ